MLSFLPAPLIGVISLVLYMLNVVFFTAILYALFLFKLIPVRKWQAICRRVINQLPYYWMDCNEMICRLTSKTVWDVQGLELLDRGGWYLLLSNHQCWADILVLFRVFRRKVPYLRFFMKKQLLWSLPFAGLACWLLDFPFMERYNKEKIAKHPELKGKDLATTKRACEKFKLIPTTITSFPEGTRFTRKKQRRQNSPYHYLLRPRAGGVAFTLAAMENCLRRIINVTIVYPEGEATAWRFFCGKQAKINVRIEVLPITPDLIGDYENDREFRVEFQNWLNKLWQKKDLLIADLKQQAKKKSQGVCDAGNQEMIS